MDSTPGVGDGSERRSAVLGDLAAARAAAIASQVEREPSSDGAEPAPEARWLETPAIVALGVPAGLLLAVVGGIATGSVGAYAIPLAVVGLAVAATCAYAVWPDAGAIGRLLLAAVAGLVTFVVGLGLGLWSYDERFVFDEDGLVWDVLALVGPLLTILGLLLTLGSLVGVVGVVIARAFRRAS